MNLVNLSLLLLNLIPSFLWLTGTHDIIWKTVKSIFELSIVNIRFLSGERIKLINWVPLRKWFKMLKRQWVLFVERRIVILILFIWKLLSLNRLLRCEISSCTWCSGSKPCKRGADISDHTRLIFCFNRLLFRLKDFSEILKVVLNDFWRPFFKL